jgi:hypothetical protein
MTHIARGMPIPQNLVNTSDRLEYLTIAMLVVSFSTGMPAILKDRILRIFVVIAFIIGLVFSMLIV